MLHFTSLIKMVPFDTAPEAGRRISQCVFVIQLFPFSSQGFSFLDQNDHGIPEETPQENQPLSEEELTRRIRKDQEILQQKLTQERKKPDLPAK